MLKFDHYIGRLKIKECGGRSTPNMGCHARYEAVETLHSKVFN
jgi:hypothetical protein